MFHMKQQDRLTHMFRGGWAPRSQAQPIRVCGIIDHLHYDKRFFVFLDDFIVLELIVLIFLFILVMLMVIIL